MLCVQVRKHPDWLGFMLSGPMTYDSLVLKSVKEKKNGW